MKRHAPHREKRGIRGSRSKALARDTLTALVADSRGRIIELEGFGAVGMAGDARVPLTAGDTLPMPEGGELMLLPQRVPVLRDLDTGELVSIPENPYQPGERICPVAAFNSPGYVHTYAPAYEEMPGAAPLPLFAYGAVGWHRGRFRSAVFRIDRERRQDLRLMPLEKIRRGAGAMQKKMPGNRLEQHLEKCALTYGCPAAKNFFIGRCEAPLPASPRCNARCLGCLSLQPFEAVSHCQDRIGFMPSAEEIAQVALAHLERVKEGVVSFGQGCEGDPLLASDVIEPAIRMIRRGTDRGTINMNTNGSLPDVLERLFNAGLDSVRISINSLRTPCYEAYFRPAGYRFSHVMQSVDLGIQMGKHVAINYLNMAGVTDSPEERAALLGFLERHPIHQIQWRNLNFDPLRYWQVMAAAAPHGRPGGIEALVQQVKAAYPRVRHGYFNPALPKERG
jgi:pyruvate-formate lyase-activating enzyme